MGSRPARTETPDGIPSPGDKALQESGPTFVVLGRKLAGSEVRATACAGDTVRSLQESFAAGCAEAPGQLRLIYEGTVLAPSARLGECGLTQGCEISIVVLPPVPDWAEQRGFTAEHCEWLRQHFSRLGMYPASHADADPELAFLDDDAQIWQKLLEEIDGREQEKVTAAGWGQRAWLVQSGRQVGHVTCSRGCQVTFEVQGCIWNLNHDSCIHQCGLAMDTMHISQLYNGVPSMPAEFKRTVHLQAPEEPGAYLLYNFSDLQYSYRDAQQNFERSKAATAAGKCYPSAFVGWLLVE